MSDRELLELAAKAAGHKYKWFGKYFHVSTDGKRYETWMPLTDDGDALRLMVKLNMDFTLSGKHAAVAQVAHATAQAFCNGDPYAATRRAIVRAAAEIGRQMQEGEEV